MSESKVGKLPRLNFKKQEPETLDLISTRRPFRKADALTNDVESFNAGFPTQRLPKARALYDSPQQTTIANAGTRSIPPIPSPASSNSSSFSTFESSPRQPVPRLSPYIPTGSRLVSQTFSTYSSRPTPHAPSSVAPRAPRRTLGLADLASLPSARHASQVSHTAATTFSHLTSRQSATPSASIATFFVPPNLRDASQPPFMHVPQPQQLPASGLMPHQLPAHISQRSAASVTSQLLRSKPSGSTNAISERESLEPELHRVGLPPQTELQAPSSNTVKPQSPSVPFSALSFSAAASRVIALETPFSSSPSPAQNPSCVESLLQVLQKPSRAPSTDLSPPNQIHLSPALPSASVTAAVTGCRATSRTSSRADRKSQMSHASHHSQRSQASQPSQPSQASLASRTSSSRSSGSGASSRAGLRTTLPQILRAGSTLKEELENDGSEFSTPYPSPLSPALALQSYSSFLTSYEQSEILDYPQAFFLGNTLQKVKGLPQALNNNGYDDDRGDYAITLHDHIGYRYEVLCVLGKGSFGQVVKVWDFKTRCYQALKIIRNKKRFHHQAAVEVKILEYCLQQDKDHSSNVVRMQEYFYFRKHLCITFELLSLNLYDFLKNNNFRGFSLALIRRFSVQILGALKFLTQHRIVHCDLKPENILLQAPNKSIIRVIDFGSSCFENERLYTYIQSRFYRSPEVILGLPYGMAIDMWSFGCILCELFTGFPIFPGESEVEQIACMMELLGPPPASMLDVATRKKVFFEPNNDPKLVANSRGKVRIPASKELSVVIKCKDANFLSFVSSCLRWIPSERLTPDQAFDHPWILEASSPTPRIAVDEPRFMKFKLNERARFIERFWSRTSTKINLVKMRSDLAPLVAEDFALLKSK